MSKIFKFIMPKYLDKKTNFDETLREMQDVLNRLKEEAANYRCKACMNKATSSPVDEPKPKHRTVDERQRDIYKPHYGLQQQGSYSTRQSHEEITKLERENKELKEKNEKLDCDLQIKESELNELNSTCRKLKTISEEKEKEACDKEKENKQIQDKLTRKYNDWEKSMSDLQSELNEKKKKICDLEKSVEKYKEEMKTIRQEHKKTIDELNHKREIDREKACTLQAVTEARCVDLEDDIQTLQNSSLMLQNQVKDLELANDHLKYKYQRLEQTEADLRSQLLRKSRKQVGVSFHTTLAPTMSSIIVDGLVNLLTRRLQQEEVDLVRKPFSGSSDITWPVLVICVNVSRLGTDAKDSMKGLGKVSKDTTLLVFHHKESHALPSQTSDRILSGSEYNQLGAIIDVAFLSQKGIYDCEMNTMAIERIASFLLQYKQ